MFRNFTRKIIEYFLNATYFINGVTVNGKVNGLQNVNFEGGNKISYGCNFSGEIEVGYRTTLGSNNYLHGNINIGKYCQIGVDVALHSTNHPTSYLTTYINQNLFDGELKELKEDYQITVGHDVWIGHNAIIVGNVSVGNGAIIAAGSVVTKNVAPYSIVAGVPAKKIKLRFSKKIADEIEALKWWNMSNEELNEIKPLFLKNLVEKESLYE